MQRTRRIMSKLGLVLLLGASLPACVVRARGEFATTGSRVAYSQPPAPRAESPRPMAGQVWVSGRWTWYNNNWVWVDGRYEPVRQGYAWQDGRWEPRNGSWHWVEGQWIVSGSGTVVVNNNTGGDRPQVQDHRYDHNPQGGVVVGNPNGGVIVGNPNGGVIVGNPNPPVGNGGVIVNNGQGGLVASNGAGTVVSTGGQVIIVPPGSPTLAPPPPRVENPGQARRGHIWIAGSWNWNTTSKQYEWIPGHWGRVKANHTWHPPRWEQRGNAWIRIEGEWRITIR